MFILYTLYTVYILRLTACAFVPIIPIIPIIPRSITSMSSSSSSPPSTTTSTLESIWKNGNFKTFTYASKERVQYLRLTSQSLGVYYDCKGQKVRVRDVSPLSTASSTHTWENEMERKHGLTVDCTYPWYDLDACEDSPEQLRIIGAFFHPVYNQHCAVQLVVRVHNNEISLLESPFILHTSLTPFRKVMVFSRNNVSMVSVTSYNGKMKTMVHAVNKNNHKGNGMTVETRFPFPLSIVERDKRFVYMVNMDDQSIYTYSSWDVILERRPNGNEYHEDVMNNDYETPSWVECIVERDTMKTYLKEERISAFHVYRRFPYECTVAVGTLEGSVHIFTMSRKDGEWVLRSHNCRSLFTGSGWASHPQRRIHKIYSDSYKIMALGEDHSLRIISLRTGEVWYTLPKVTDTSFCTFLQSTHQFLIMDGTEKGLVVREIQQQSSTSKFTQTHHQQEMEQMWRWTQSSPEIPSPTPLPLMKKKETVFSYIQFLMSTPVYGVQDRNIYNFNHTHQGIVKGNNTNSVLKK